jgi:hypothetical protein
MKLKYCLIAATLAAGAASLPAHADGRIGVSIGIGIPVAPPPVVYEPPPPPPAYGYVWIPGYWGWQGERYVWIRGRYAYGRPGYAWRPDRWEQHGDRWHHVAGDWERERHGERGEHGHGHH